MLMLMRKPLFQVRESGFGIEMAWIFQCNSW